MSTVCSGTVVKSQNYIHEEIQNSRNACYQFSSLHLTSKNVKIKIYYIYNFNYDLPVILLTVILL
jgi:hypothetical protein